MDLAVSSSTVELSAIVDPEPNTVATVNEIVAMLAAPAPLIPASSTKPYAAWPTDVSDTRSRAVSPALLPCDTVVSATATSAPNFLLNTKR
jgi:hypothetical protein